VSAWASPETAPWTARRGVAARLAQGSGGRTSRGGWLALWWAGSGRTGAVVATELTVTEW